MSEWSAVRGGGGLFALAVTSASSRGVNVTSGAANVKGLWTELNPATARSYAGFQLNFRCFLATRAALDIGIGAAGSELVLVPNITIQALQSASLYLPVAIPKGVRLAARAQTEAGATALIVGMTGVPNNPLWPRGLSAGNNVGFVTGTTRGVPCNAGAVANTKGAWADLTLSLTNPAKVLYVLLMEGATTPTASCDLLCDIGIWDGAAYQVLIPDLFFRNTATTPPIPAHIGPFPVNLPAGARLGARLSCSSTDAGGRTADVSLLALR